MKGGGDTRRVLARESAGLNAMGSKLLSAQLPVLIPVALVLGTVLVVCLVHLLRRRRIHDQGEKDPCLHRCARQAC